MSIEIWNIFLILCLVHNDRVNCAPKSIAKNNEPVSNPMPQWNLPDVERAVGPSDESSKDFWYGNSLSILQRQLQLNQQNKNIAKKVIFFIGDGMSIPTLMATRMYMGGEEKQLSFEKFPYTGFAKVNFVVSSVYVTLNHSYKEFLSYFTETLLTYCVNHQVGDSACTATALFSGVKNNYGTLGVTSSVQYGNCTAEQIGDYHLENIFKWAQDSGKSTGVVTTTRLTHATPAAAYAKSAHRNWENDAVTPKGCVDIAHQLVYSDVGKNMQILLGGGRKHFVPTPKKDSVNGGLRNDGRNLIDEWMALRSRIGSPLFVDNKNSLLNVNASEVDYLLGIFNDDHLSYNLEKPAEEPTLTDMASVAMNMLNQNDNGYLLLIEAGRIDMAHHENRARVALDETVQLHNAVDYIVNHVDLRDTLIIVTSDHSHTMSIGGYPRRGNNILGLADTSTEDSKPYFTLSYANGMGYYNHTHPNGTRKNPKSMNFYTTDFQYPATVPLDMETHGGEDVAVFAVGPWSHLFTGTYEQNFIAEGIKYAMCISPGDKGRFCSNGSRLSPNIIFMVAILSLIVLVKAIV